MKITFSLKTDEDIERAMLMLSSMSGPTPVAVAVAAPVAAPVAVAETPAPVAEAPVLPVAPAPVAETAIPEAVAGVELDSRNTPWIDAVHAGTKTKDVNGAWKKKRGVPVEVQMAAEAEARGEIAQTPQAELPLEPVVLPGEVMEPTVTMEQVHAAWAECVTNGLITPADAPAMYEQVGINPAALSTNETERAKMHAHLQSLLSFQP